MLANQISQRYRTQATPLFSGVKQGCCPVFLTEWKIPLENSLNIIQIAIKTEVLRAIYD